MGCRHSGANPVILVYLVSLVCLVYLVESDEPNRPDKPDLKANTRLCMWPGYRGFLSQGWRVGLVHLVYFVCLVCLVEPDKPNQPDEPNKPDRPVLKILLTSHVLIPILTT